MVLKKKYNIETVIASFKCGGILYIKNSSRAAFIKIIRPHILNSGVHLLNRPTIYLICLGTLHTKRSFSTLPDTVSSRDFKRKLRKKYELTLEQKEAII